MTSHPKSLLFYPTSPSHIANLNLLASKLTGWRLICVISDFAAKNSPGILSAAEESAYKIIVFDDSDKLEFLLPDNASIVMLGAVFEPNALEFFLWAKLRGIPAVAVEEVAQLSLNDMTINNYDLPLDMLFVANRAEYDLFGKVGYSQDMLSVSGLLSTERAQLSYDKNKIFTKLGLNGDRRILLYTTSPLRNRYAIHNRDDWKFRKEVLEVLSSNICDKWQIIIKLHPNENLELERRRICEIIPSALVLGRETDVNELLEISCVILNRGNSQTVLDAVLKRCPAIIIASGTKTLFHEYGGAFVVEELSEMPRILDRIEAGETACDDRFFAQNYHVPPEGVSSFIVGKLGQLAECSCIHDAGKWEWTVRTFLFFGMMKRLPKLFSRLENKSPLLRAVECAVKKQIRGRKKSAVTYWEECCKLAPDWFYPHYELAHIYHSKKCWDDCLRQVDNALQKHPPFHFLWHAIPLIILKSSCQRAMGNPCDAIDAMLSFETSGVIECLPELHIEKARNLFEVGKVCDALPLLDRAYEILNGPDPLWPKVDAIFFHRMGLLYDEMGFQERALDCIRRGRSLNPSETLYFSQKAIASFRKKKYLGFFINSARYAYLRFVGLYKLVTF